MIISRIGQKIIRTVVRCTKLCTVIGTTHVICCTGFCSFRFGFSEFFSSSTKLPTGLYIVPIVISFLFFFNCRQIITGSIGRIFAIFAPNDRYLFEYDRFGPLFWFLKGRCHGNQLKSKNWRFFGPIYFVTLPFRNGLQYRNSDFNRLNRMCTILVTFGQETPEFTLLTIAPFAAIRQKSIMTSNISEYPGPILTYFTGLVDVLVGMIIPMFVWHSPIGRCYGNQLNLDDGCRHRQERPFFSLRRSTTYWPIVNPLWKD